MEKGYSTDVEKIQRSFILTLETNLNLITFLLELYLLYLDYKVIVEFHLNCERGKERLLLLLIFFNLGSFSFIPSGTVIVRW